jgi:hypothetical protein
MRRFSIGERCHSGPVRLRAHTRPIWLPTHARAHGVRSHANQRGLRTHLHRHPLRWHVDTNRLWRRIGPHDLRRCSDLQEGVWRSRRALSRRRLRLLNLGLIGCARQPASLGTRSRLYAVYRRRLLHQERICALGNHRRARRTVQRVGHFLAASARRRRSRIRRGPRRARFHQRRKRSALPNVLQHRLFARHRESNRQLRCPRRRGNLCHRGSFGQAGSLWRRVRI